jgi:osmotically-inducible protein OsmY
VYDALIKGMHDRRETRKIVDKHILDETRAYLAKHAHIQADIRITITNEREGLFIQASTEEQALA